MTKRPSPTNGARRGANQAKAAPPRFIDLFCGIGGIRLAYEATGAQCVFSSDWDKYAQQTYELNFGEKPAGDIHDVDAAGIPDHEILTAGFPCQPFSISGVSKKNSLGRAHGFQDKIQGTLFFEIARILREKKPEAFMLENVKHLLRHDGGRTFAVILGTLEELGYQVHHRVIDAQDYVPQHRERIFLVGFRTPRAFEWPERRVRAVRLRDVLEKKHGEKYVLTSHLWKYLKAYAKKHQAAGNGFGYGTIGKDLEDGVTRTLSARYYKDGSEILVLRGENTRTRPRRLTPRECARLMGFPDTFRIEVSDTQAYKQFGNSVVVPVVADVARQVVLALQSPATMRPAAREQRARQVELVPA